MIAQSIKVKTYKYKVYGLSIASEILMPELLTLNNEEDVDGVISYGILPKEISQEIDNNKNFHFEKEKMWFYIKDVAKYYIHSGNTIIVEPFDNADSHVVKAFLLGSAFGMLLIQRHIIAIHGGTIVVNDKALIITGEQGVGKSTLTSAFRDKGYFFMADDVSVIAKRKDGQPIIYPGYPQQKLCRDAMEKMGYTIEAFKRIDEGRDKYAIPAHENFIKNPMLIGAICEITVGEGEMVEIEEVTGIEKLKSLLNNIYRVEVMQYSGMSPKYFKNCLELAKTVVFFKIKRPKNKFTVEEQISVIENALENRYKRILQTTLV